MEKGGLRLIIRSLCWARYGDARYMQPETRDGDGVGDVVESDYMEPETRDGGGAVAVEPHYTLPESVEGHHYTVPESVEEATHANAPVAPKAHLRGTAAAVKRPSIAPHRVNMVAEMSLGKRDTLPSLCLYVCLPLSVSVHSLSLCVFRSLCFSSLCLSLSYSSARGILSLIPFPPSRNLPLLPVCQT